VDDVLGATQSTRGRNLPRAAATSGERTYSETYVRSRKHQKVAAAKDLHQGDGSDNEDYHQVQEPTPNEKDAAETSIDDEEECGAADDQYQFKLDDDVI
jgi:hypothetical protein